MVVSRDTCYTRWKDNELSSFISDMSQDERQSEEEDEVGNEVRWRDLERVGS